MCEMCGKDDKVKKYFINEEDISLCISCKKDVDDLLKDPDFLALKEYLSRI